MLTVTDAAGKPRDQRAEFLSWPATLDEAVNISQPFGEGVTQMTKYLFIETRDPFESR